MEDNIKPTKMPPFVISGKTLFESSVPENPMLWGHFLPKIGIALLVGSSDCGKSSLTRQLIDAIVFDEPEFLGLDLDLTYNRAIYVSSEDTDEDIKRIMKREHISGRSSDPYEEISFIFETEKIDEKLEAVLQVKPVDIVIMDSLNDFIRGDANVSYNVRLFLEKIRGLAMKHKCLFVLIHHFRKSAPETNSQKNDILGSQSFEAKARAVISLENDASNPSGKLLKIIKGNYVSEEFKRKILKISPNNNFIFKSIGESLVDKNATRISSRKLDDKMRGAIEMFSGQGYSSREIEAKLKSMGHVISKSTISEFLKNRDGTVQCPES